MSDVEAEKPAKKRGRPAGKRGTFSFRTTPSLRAKLEEASAKSQRPVSEEIESRLERSFDEELNALRRAMFGDPHTEAMLRKLVWAARLIEDWNTRVQGNPSSLWSKDEALRAAMRGAAIDIIKDATPFTREVQKTDPLTAYTMGTFSLEDLGPIERAKDYGHSIGRFLTGNSFAEPEPVKNLGMGTQDDGE